MKMRSFTKKITAQFYGHYFLLHQPAIVSHRILFFLGFKRKKQKKNVLT